MNPNVNALTQSSRLIAAGANAAGKASTGTYSLKEIHTILNIFLKITEIEDNTIRLLVKDQDLEYDERQHDNETTTTNNMRILDKLLQCLEQLLSLFDSSNNTDSVDITIISNLMLLFGQLGCINISTKQFNNENDPGQPASQFTDLLMSSSGCRATKCNRSYHYNLISQLNWRSTTLTFPQLVVMLRLTTILKP